MTNSRIHPGMLIYNIIKYFIYVALAYNVYAFFVEEWAAFQHTHAGGLTSPSQLIETFAATIDTAAWVVLLYLFEAETFIMSDERVRRYKYPMILLKGLCYAFIVYACWGYIHKLWYVLNTSVATIPDACAAVSQNLSLMVDLDEYESLTAANCVDLTGQSLLQINGTSIVGTESVFADTIKLAMVDVINAASWVLVVVVLEIDVRLQLAGKLTDQGMKVGYVVKGLLYLALFVCAVYWGFYGDFLDFWDAFLWLLAFFMIELNIFNWHEHVKEEEEEASLA